VRREKEGRQGFRKKVFLLIVSKPWREKFPIEKSFDTGDVEISTAKAGVFFHRVDFLHSALNNTAKRGVGKFWHGKPLLKKRDLQREGGSIEGGRMPAGKTPADDRMGRNATDRKELSCGRG